MSLNEVQHRLRRKQKKEHEWDTLASVWEQRLDGSLMDIALPSEFSSATTKKDGTKKFFLCDSKKVDVKSIKDKSFKFVKKAVASVSINEQSTSSLSRVMGTTTTLPKLSILKDHPSADLLKLSFVKPTLTGNSIGPGDAHARALANYYHVQDHLAPPPLEPGVVPGAILYYENSAPPMRPLDMPLQEMKEGRVEAKDKGLLCGASGKEIPYPHVVDYRDEKERLAFLSTGIKAITKNTAPNPHPTRKLQYGNRPVGGTASLIFDHLDSVTSSATPSVADDVVSVASSTSRVPRGSIAGSISSSTSGRGTRAARKTKVLSSKDVQDSLEEMKALMDDIGSGKSVSRKEGGPKGWAHAGLAIQKHFGILKRGDRDAGKYLYKDAAPHRTYKRFVEEGARRGDGCFDSDPVMEGALQVSPEQRDDGVSEGATLLVPCSQLPCSSHSTNQFSSAQIEGLLHSTKEYKSVLRVNENKKSVAQMKQTPSQERILGELEKELRRAQRRLEKSEIWQMQHGRGDRVKDKRDFGMLWESESESEEEEVEEKRPKTREELWGGDAVDVFAPVPVEKKQEKKKNEYNDAEVFSGGMDLLEECLQEYVCEYITIELERLEELGLEACVVEVQSRFRGWSWRNGNYKVVNRLAMRAKSRAKNRETGRGAVEEQGRGGAEWESLQDADGNWYYLNKETGESQWA